MMTYAEFVADVNDRAKANTERAARFGEVSADELRNKFDRLASGIKSLGIEMRSAQVIENTISLTTLNQWNVFELAWLAFYVENRPWDIWWSSDEEWTAVEAWNLDFRAWRKLYEERSAKKPPPHIDLKDVPGPQKKPFKIPVPVFGPVGGVGVGLGLGFAAAVVLFVYVQSQTKAARAAKG